MSARSDDAEPVSGDRLRPDELALVVTLGIASFLVSLSGMSMAPFLWTMAAEFDVSFGAITHVFSLQAIAWGACAPFAGRLSDRIGRRPLIIAAVALLALSRFALGLVDGYWAALFWQLVAGVCGGVFGSTALVAVSDRVADRRLGRALGWLVTGQSLSMLAGVPLLTLIAAGSGWRGSMVVHGIATTVILLLLPRVIRASGRRCHAAAARPPLRATLDRRLLRLLFAGLMERVTFASLAIYLASFLEAQYGLGFTGLSAALAVVAAGNFAGNAFGGRIADRVPDRTALFAKSLAATAVLILPLMLYAPSYVFSTALGCVAMLVSALGRPSYLAVLSSVPAHSRGAVMGINVMLASTSWLGAALIGGLVGVWGYGVVALFSAGTAALGAVAALSPLAARGASAPERRLPPPGP